MTEQIIYQAALRGLQAIYKNRFPPSQSVEPCYVKCKHCKRIVDVAYEWVEGQNIYGGSIFDIDCPHCWTLNTITSIEATRKLRSFQKRCENWINPKASIQKRVPKKLRFEVLERDNFSCQYCGATPSDGTSLHVDHKVSVTDGGHTSLANLITACAGCNLGKGSRSITL